MEAAAAPLKGIHVVQYHKSWAYLLDWLGIQSVGELEPRPGIPPSASHVTRLAGEVKQKEVRFVIQTVYAPRRACPVFSPKGRGEITSIAVYGRVLAQRENDLGQVGHNDCHVDGERLSKEQTLSSNDSIVQLSGISIGYTSPFLTGIDLEIQRGQFWELWVPMGLAKPHLRKLCLGSFLLWRVRLSGAPNAPH